MQILTRFVVMDKTPYLDTAILQRVEILLFLHMVGKDEDFSKGPKPFELQSETLRALDE